MLCGSRNHDPENLNGGLGFIQLHSVPINVARLSFIAKAPWEKLLLVLGCLEKWIAAKKLLLVPSRLGKGNGGGIGQLLRERVCPGNSSGVNLPDKGREGAIRAPMQMEESAASPPD